jgi:5,10-methylenetetrahydromethanopterin reductase
MFATSVATAEHIACAEQLGYQYAFVYDSPTIYADPWMILALAAERTSRISLGVAVITPRLRHLTASACALATLAALAPQRSLVVVGAGFTSQAMLGQKPARWSEVASFVNGLRKLLAGEEIELEGQTVGLFHAAATGMQSPANMPVWIAANGPKGCDVGQQIGDLVLTSARPVKPVSRAPWGVTLHGVVLEDNEDLTSESVIASAGPAAAFMLHRGAAGPAAGTPEAAAYAEQINRVPEHRRHIATHRGHLIEVQSMERPLITPELIRRTTFTGTAEQVRTRLNNLSRAGTETVLYQAVGPDIPAASPRSQKSHSTPEHLARTTDILRRGPSDPAARTRPLLDLMRPASTFGEAPKLRPSDVGMDFVSRARGGETAVVASDDAPIADNSREARDALRNQVWMFDQGDAV